MADQEDFNVQRIAAVSGVYLALGTASLLHILSSLKQTIDKPLDLSISIMLLVLAVHNLVFYIFFVRAPRRQDSINLAQYLFLYRAIHCLAS